MPHFKERQLLEGSTYSGVIGEVVIGGGIYLRPIAYKRKYSTLLLTISIAYTAQRLKTKNIRHNEYIWYLKHSQEYSFLGPLKTYFESKSTNHEVHINFNS